jgi:hypothetical protein
MRVVGRCFHQDKILSLSFYCDKRNKSGNPSSVSFCEIEALSLGYSKLAAVSKIFDSFFAPFFAAEAESRPLGGIEKSLDQYIARIERQTL